MIRTVLRLSQGLACLAAIHASVLGQCGPDWRSLGVADGVTGPDGYGRVWATLWWDRDGAGPGTPVLVVGGAFDSAGHAAANCIATYDPATDLWAPLGAGVNGEVRAIAALANGDLVVAGEFATAGNQTANNIARWDGTTWSALGTGVDSVVNALAVLLDGDVVAGGSFANAGGAAANRIARWDGNTWQPLGAGVTVSPYGPMVRSLLVEPNGDLLVGGQFTNAGAVTSPNLARWNGTTWSSVAGAVVPPVFAMTRLANGDVVTGGWYNGNTCPLHRFDGTSWQWLANANNAIWSLATAPNGDLIVGGEFTSLFTGVANTAATRIARWDGAQWSALGTGVGAPQPAHVYTIATAAGDVVAGGDFVMAGGQPVHRIAKWNGAMWASLGQATAPNGGITTLARAPSGDVVAGGEFWSIGTLFASRVARWNGAAWSTIGIGFTDSVNAVAVLSNGEVIAGGSFTSIYTTTGTSPMSYIARWNGAGWVQMGSGTNGRVYALLALANGDVVAGGEFTLAGGVSAPGIARWNGTSWSPFGTGCLSVQALAELPNGDIVAGGWFPSAGGVLANNVARWNGSGWAALGAGCGNFVRSLCVLPGGDLLAGGAFQAAGSVAANRIARWDGTTWHPLGAGVVDPFQPGGTVEAIALLPDGDLLVGGQFGQAGSSPARNIARWDGSAWTPVGSGADGVVRDMLSLPNGGVFVGGHFASVGGVVSVHAAELTSTCPATAAPFGAGCTGTGGQGLLTATALPWLGATFRATATGMPAAGFCVAISGLGTLSLPLDTVLPQALPGCVGLVTPDDLRIVFPSSGVANTSMDVPTTAGLVGLWFHHQVLAFDRTTAVMAITSTNALTVTVGAL